MTSSDAWRRHSGGAPVAPNRSGLLAEGTLPAEWARTWRQNPSQPLLYSVPDRRWIVAGEFEERTRARAGTLAALGVAPGDRVACCTNSPMDFIEWHIGILRLGAVAVPINPEYGQREFMHIIRDARPVTAVVHDAERAAMVSGAVDTVVVVDQASPRPVDVALDDVDTRAMALLPYTSGTTGAPKGAPLSHRNL